MSPRRAAPLLIALLLVTAGLVGCGDDGDDDAGTTTTTEADGGSDDDGGDDETTTEPTATETTDDAGSTTAPDGDDDETTVPDGDSTTSPDLPPNDSPLAELLLDPATLGPEYAADDSLGDGSLDTDLCEEVTLEETWDDQAAQALLAGTGDDAAIFQQAVLRFSDDAAAEAFYAELTAGLVTCEPGTEPTDLAGIGDEALIATAPDTEATTRAGVVRVGDLVGWLLGLTGPGVASPVTEDVIASAADLLAG